MNGNTNARTSRTTSRAAQRALVLLLAAAACGKPAPAPTMSAIERVRTVSFDQLCNWEYTDGMTGMPESVKALNGARIEITGYMHSSREDEWLLAHLRDYLRAHCDGPELNEMVVVTAPKDAAKPMHGQRIKLVGTFDVTAVYMGGGCTQIYGLRAEHVEIVN